MKRSGGEEELRGAGGEGSKEGKEEGAGGIGAMPEAVALQIHARCATGIAHHAYILTSVLTMTCAQAGRCVDTGSVCGGWWGGGGGMASCIEVKRGMMQKEPGLRQPYHVPTVPPGSLTMHISSPVSCQ